MIEFVVDAYGYVFESDGSRKPHRMRRHLREDQFSANEIYEKELAFSQAHYVEILRWNPEQGKYVNFVTGFPRIWREEKQIPVPSPVNRAETIQQVLF